MWIKTLFRSAGIAGGARFCSSARIARGTIRGLSVHIVVSLQNMPIYDGAQMSSSGLLVFQCFIISNLSTFRENRTVVDVCGDPAQARDEEHAHSPHDATQPLV